MRTARYLRVELLPQMPFAITKPLEDLIKTPRAAARLRYNKKEKPAPAPAGGSKTVSAKGAPAPGGFVPPTTVGGSTTVTPPVSGLVAKKDRASIRLVSSGDKPWQRKNGFKGEEVEVTPLMPTLVTLVQLIDKDAEAKAALSEFLRVLETAGVPDQLTDKA